MLRRRRINGKGRREDGAFDSETVGDSVMQ